MSKRGEAELIAMAIQAELSGKVPNAVENTIAAITPGGIEAQEARGQAELIAMAIQAELSGKVPNAVENAIAAITPGGIEAQEARGQAALCRESARLPKRASSYEPEIPRDLYERMGIVFGEDVDDLFVSVTLPAGWKVEPTGHSMWNHLVDERGRERASIFYKAAFYDRAAHMSPRPRFSISKFYCDSEGNPAYEGERRHFEPTHEVYRVEDAGVMVFRPALAPKWNGSHADHDAWKTAETAQYAECEAWLAERYPDWRDPLAYWDAE
jgi:hypothetical protein